MNTIVENLFKRGCITQKRIAAITSEVLCHKKDFTFDDCRRKVSQYGKAKRNTERAEIITELCAIHYTGVFNAVDIANILNCYEPEMAVEKARAQIDEMEKSYKANLNAVKILRRGASQVIPKKWDVTFTPNARTVEMRIEPSVRKPFVGVTVKGAGNAYAFLTMLLIVRPMLTSKGIRFSMDTLETIGHIWSMGESKIAYGERGWTGKQMIETSKKSWRDYFANYALPDDIKAQILDLLQDSIAQVEHGVGTDSEGNSYNGLLHKPIPEKGVWVGAGKTA